MPLNDRIPVSYMEHTLQIIYYDTFPYDLAVSLKVYSIQTLDAPRFDELLIMLGNFNLELAFYGVIGTFINENGAEYLLTESGILAEGSLMSFIRGKYYNRCVRIHDILALVMERKMYDTFMSTLTHEMKDAINDLLSNVPQDCGTHEQYLETSPIFQQHMGEFDVYLKKTMDGDLGLTAQYWSMYVHMVNRVYRDLVRTLRTNDVDTASHDWYIFGLNRPNYACWGVLFLNQLAKEATQSQAVL